jgi:hypothetical protein
VFEECGGFTSSGNNNTDEEKEMAEGLVFYGSRELQGYEVFKDNAPIDFTTETNYLDTDGLDYLVEYCYNVTAVYDEGSSAFSNTACDSPQLDGPTGLSVEGTGSFLTLGWNPPAMNDQDGFNIYKENEFYAFTTDTVFEDYETELAVEYCYTVKALYNDIGESPASNESCGMWEIFPPSEIAIEAGDGYIDLSWEMPVNPTADLVGTWDLYFDWYCSGYPGGPSAAEFFEDGRAPWISRAIPVKIQIPSSN